MIAAGAPGGAMWAPVVIEADMMMRRVAFVKASLFGQLTLLLGVPAFLFFFVPFMTLLGYGAPGDNWLAQAAFGFPVGIAWAFMARAAVTRVRRTMGLHRLRIAVGGGGVVLSLPQREVAVALQDIARVAVRLDTKRGLFGARTHYTSAIGLTDGRWIVLGAVKSDQLGALIGQATDVIAQARGVTVENLGAAGWRVSHVRTDAAATA